MFSKKAAVFTALSALCLCSLNTPVHAAQDDGKVEAVASDGGLADYNRGKKAFEAADVEEAVRYLLLATHRGLPDDKRKDAMAVLGFLKKTEREAFDVGWKAAIQTATSKSRPTRLDIAPLFSAQPLQVTGFLGTDYINGIASSVLKDDVTATPYRTNDFRFHLNADVAYPFTLSNNEVKGRVGYRLSVLEYANYTTYRSHGHTGYLTFAGQAAPDTGWDLSFDAAKYLSGSTVSAYATALHAGGGITRNLASLMKDNFKVRIGLDVNRIDYDHNSNADGNKVTVSTKAAWVPKALDEKWTFTLGGTLGRSKASLDRLQYNLAKVQGGASWQIDPIQSIGVTANFTSNVFDGRDNFETSVRRKDLISGVSLSHNYRLTSWMDIVSSLSYTDFDSTLARQDYQTTVISTGIVFRF